MKLVCELYRKIHNSTKIYGICSRQYSQITTATTTTTNRVASNEFLNELNKTHLFDPHKIFLGSSSHVTSLKAQFSAWHKFALVLYRIFSLTE